MRRQCVPGSLFSAYEREPGDEASTLYAGNYFDDHFQFQLFRFLRLQVPVPLRVISVALVIHSKISTRCYSPVAFAIACYRYESTPPYAGFGLARTLLSVGCTGLVQAVATCEFQPVQLILLSRCFLYYYQASAARYALPLPLFLLSPRTNQFV